MLTVPAQRFSIVVIGDPPTGTALCHGDIGQGLKWIALFVRGCFVILRNGQGPEVVFVIDGCLCFQMSPSFDAISNIVPPREAWRLKVRIVPSFENSDSPNSTELILVDENLNKIQATIRKQLINRFKDNIIEGNCYKMCYFFVVPNHCSYRATKHEFKLTFLF
ncbi:hypothetical protein Ahy_B07g086522 [Arachis hypogaea]|uniref:Replication protein A 70 kDa DNA-binding subunit B/D first OB fold domain-containing protein n=1 Tax=Arachis hypogaea TaxID=3818 RepID=A0A444YA86_ARAHY|nr:hypothetical protein Ahy_B07g086522 [Arachis hypogaea]